MDNNSKSINILLRKYLSGNLSDADRPIVQQWIEEHKDQYQQIMESRDLTEEYLKYAAINSERAWRKFHREHFVFWKLRVWRPYFYAAAAVVLLLVILVPLLLHEERSVSTVVLTPEVKAIMQRSQQMGRNGATLIVGHRHVTVSSEQTLQQESVLLQSDEEFNSRYTLETEKGKEFWVTLDDGTRVHLDYNTSLKYPEHFDVDNRTVSLNGEAYFDVAKDAGRPFRVITPHGIVKVYGTQFNVDTRSGNCTMVALVNGKVSITSDGGLEYTMHPGQLAQMKRGEEPTVSTVDLVPYVSWNTGKYVFDGCNMSKLMQILGNWYDMDVIVINSEAAQIEFSGSIDRYKDLDATLSAIEFVTGCTITQEGRNIIVR